MSRTSLVMRSLFLLGFVLAMPLLALPSVARWADEFLYGDSSPSSAERKPVIHADDDSADAQREVVQAALETPLSDSARSQTGGGRGLDAVTPQPPEMPPSPDFPPSAVDDGKWLPTQPLDLQFDPSSFDSPRPQGSGLSANESANAGLQDRLDEIRQRLEDLGAEYIRVETLPGDGKYHCECRMLVTPGSAVTETFEASGKDATAVAEQVLEAIEAWRSSRASQSP